MCGRGAILAIPLPAEIKPLGRMQSPIQRNYHLSACSRAYRYQADKSNNDCECCADLLHCSPLSNHLVAAWTPVERRNANADLASSVNRNLPFLFQRRQELCAALAPEEASSR